jgi:hypothetical protein
VHTLDADVDDDAEVLARLDRTTVRVAPSSPGRGLNFQTCPTRYLPVFSSVSIESFPFFVSDAKAAPQQAMATNAIQRAHVFTDCLPERRSPER